MFAVRDKYLEVQEEKTKMVACKNNDSIYCESLPN